MRIDSCCSMVSLLVIVLWAGIVGAAPIEPNYMPHCYSPQMLAPMQAIGGDSVDSRTSVAWNGQEFGMVWIDYNYQRLKFQAFYADGTPATAVTTPSEKDSLGYFNMHPTLVWNGTHYAVAWAALDGGLSQIFLAFLNRNGTMIGTEIKASFTGMPATVDCYYPNMAYGYNHYAIVWSDARNGDNDIYCSIIDCDGIYVTTDFMISTQAYDSQYSPSVTWSTAGHCFVVVWLDSRDSVTAIWSNWTDHGGLTGSEVQLVWTGQYVLSPMVTETGSSLGLTWSDIRDSYLEIYFARLSYNGSYKIGSDIRVSNSFTYANYPYLVWTGAEYGLFWLDERNWSSDIWYNRLDANGSVLGADTQVSYGSGLQYPGAAFADYSFMVTASTYGYVNLAFPWGCSYDDTPPTCPESLGVYNITGTTATVTWLPSQDLETGVSYYQVYRNNTLIAQTSDTEYDDTGLSLSTTYKYDIRAVNAAQLVTTDCPSSTIYLKTNASLMLMLNKNDWDAILSWTNEGMNAYNIFRGTNPQVLSQIGSTAELFYNDPNIVRDNLNYFYTVDEPGW
ncbi:fibronectin type III domain-containing protein [bacterium]|nr:fibronectin type III domain-containing protein [bacterium]